MGYCTRYSGEVVSGANEKDVALAIEALDYFHFDSRNTSWIETINDVISFDAIKWYDHEKDMREVSKQFPDALILIHGEGEESGDLWNSYFKNGKSITYQAKIIYPEFNEKDLT